MRELKDYFCTFTQKQQLLDLGFDGDSHIITAEYYYNISIPFEGILRSQALDYFRELGYKIVINQNERGHWYEIEKDGIMRTQGGWLAYEFAESKAISLLIELEKEARNGK